MNIHNYLYKGSDTFFRLQAIHTHLGEENIKAVVNFALRYIADLDIPIKRLVFCYRVQRKSESNLNLHHFPEAPLSSSGRVC